MAIDVQERWRELVTRSRSGSVRRMWRLACEEGERGHVPAPLVFADMARCIARYGIGYQEYVSYGFLGKGSALRSTFMTMGHNVGLTRAVCQRDLYPTFEDKVEFLRTFDRYVGRDWLDVRTATADEVADFVSGHRTVFAKPLDSFGGQGIARLQDEPRPQDPSAFREALLAKGQALLEEGIVQHPQMDLLCSSSVNTIRVVTLVVGGEAHHVYSLVRMGLGNNYVDNVSSGGMYTWVDDDGVLRYPCFHDKTASYVEEHPATGMRVVGFEIPLYREVVALCLEAALVEPRVGYVGWDVAVTPKGPVLVEGNLIPGFDMPQAAAFHPDGKGILPKFEQILGRPVPR